MTRILLLLSPLISFLISCTSTSSPYPVFDSSTVIKNHPFLKNALIVASDYAETKSEKWSSDGAIQLTPGASLKITVQNEFETTETILPDGSIYLRHIKRISAGSKTLSQLKDEISEKLREFLKDPQVSISVLESTLEIEESINVSVYGLVGKPGPHVLRKIFTLESARWAAEGFKQGACMTQILVLRGKKVIVCDFYKLFYQGEIRENLRLQQDDVIIVPKLSEDDQILAEWKHIEEFIKGQISIEQLAKLLK